MFALKIKADPTPLEIENARLFDRLKELSPDSDEYALTAAQLVVLYKLNEETSSKKRVSADKLADVLCNLTGIVLVLNYERAAIVLSKAFGNVWKSR